MAGTRPIISCPSPPRFLTGCWPFQMCSSEPQTVGPQHLQDDRVALGFGNVVFRHGQLHGLGSSGPDVRCSRVMPAPNLGCVATGTDSRQAGACGRWAVRSRLRVSGARSMGIPPALHKSPGLRPGRGTWPVSPNCARRAAGRLARRGRVRGSRAAPSPTGPARNRGQHPLEAGLAVGVDVQRTPLSSRCARIRCMPWVMTYSNHTSVPSGSPSSRSYSSFSASVSAAGSWTRASHRTSPTTRPRCSEAPAGRIGATGTQRVRRGPDRSSTCQEIGLPSRRYSQLPASMIRSLAPGSGDDRAAFPPRAGGDGGAGSSRHAATGWSTSRGRAGPRR